MPSDDAATEPFDAGAWDTDAAADAVLESEASLWPQALRASAAIAAVTAAVAVTGGFYATVLALSSGIFTRNRLVGLVCQLRPVLRERVSAPGTGECVEPRHYR